MGVMPGRMSLQHTMISAGRVATLLVVIFAALSCASAKQDVVQTRSFSYYVQNTATVQVAGRNGNVSNPGFGAIVSFDNLLTADQAGSVVVGSSRGISANSNQLTTNAYFIHRFNGTLGQGYLCFVGQIDFLSAENTAVVVGGTGNFAFLSGIARVEGGLSTAFVFKYTLHLLYGAIQQPSFSNIQSS